MSGKRVLAVMRGLGLRARGTTRGHGRARPVEKGDPRVNLVNRAFDAGARNRPRAGDATHIDADEGRLCLAAVTGAWHHKVVGRSTTGGATERPPIDAPGQAVGREGPPDDLSLAFRDDRGPQNASRALQRRLGSHGMAQSMSGPGNPRDDAVAEPFFETLERELVSGRGFKSKDEARREAFKYIELYHKGQRLHSRSGCMAPCDLGRDAA